MKVINESIKEKFDDNLLSEKEEQEILGGDCQKACGANGCVWDNSVVCNDIPGCLVDTP